MNQGYRLELGPVEGSGSGFSGSRRVTSLTATSAMMPARTPDRLTSGEWGRLTIGHGLNPALNAKAELVSKYQT